MFKIVCFGLIQLFSIANGFDFNKYLKDNCETYSSTLSCSYIKFTAEAQNVIQDTNFMISNATYVRFQNCEVVANGAFFEKFPNAMQFDFYDCYIDVFTSTRRSVSPHKELKELSIRTSRVTNGFGTTNSGLTTLTSLKTIYFYSTSLSNGITNGFFQQIPQIEEISLHNCELFSSNTEDSFRGLSELKTLYINGNSYSALNVDLFRDLKKLTHLTLDFNGIDQLPAKLLPSSLEYLSLRNNSLRFITRNMFSQLTSLNTLYISENEIEYISESAFYNLAKLKYLHLQNNKITTFTENHLNGLKNLVWIDISGNEVEYLDSGIFDGLESLEYLNY